MRNDQGHHPQGPERILLRPDGRRPGDLRARGKFRYQKITPWWGTGWPSPSRTTAPGSLDHILPRRNAFQRPAVANLDQLVIIASGAIPVSDPFLLDRIISLAESKGCQPILCINKWDLVQAEDLFAIYQAAGIPTLSVSAATGQGIEELRGLLAGKISAFTGNSGVGKSSILNALEPNFGLTTGEVSEKLGRGRPHHPPCGTVPRGPGASSPTPPASLPLTMRRAGEPLDKDAAGPVLPGASGPTWASAASSAAPTQGKGCAVLAAVKAGDIPKSRHRSYVRLYELAKENKPWEK